MKRPGRSRFRFAFALILSAMGLATGAVLAGWLDRFSGSGRVAVKPALFAIWIYGVLILTVLGLVRFRPRPVKLLLMLVTVVATLAMVEVAARLIGFPRRPFRGQPSRELHHVMPPSSEMYHGNFEGVEVFVRTNADGLRTTYGQEGFRRHGTRIAVLGDSFTLGFGVPAEQAFPARLEDLLRAGASDADVAVLNAGVVSYSPIIQRRQYERIVASYEPDLVILMLDMSDIGDDLKYAGELSDGLFAQPRNDSRSGFPGAVGQLLLDPVLDGLMYPYRVLSGGAPASYSYLEFQLEIGGQTERNRYFIYRHPLDLTRPFFDSTMRHVKSIAAAVERQGAKFVLFVAPRFHHWNPKEAPDNWEASEYALSEPYQFEYRRYFDEARLGVEFPIVDLLTDFRNAKEFPLVFRRDPHWNSDGHRFVARVLRDHLEDLQLLDR